MSAMKHLFQLMSDKKYEKKDDKKESLLSTTAGLGASFSDFKIDASA